MTFDWDPDKNAANLADRGFDFAFASLVFDGRTVEREDSRREYDERRSVASMPKPSKPPMPSRGKADLARLRRMTDRQIAATAPEELPLLPDSFWREARVVSPVGKRAISLRIDEDVVDWFRASGPKYQSRMNTVLRMYVDAVRAQSRKRGTRAG